ncbi:MAG: sulfotransferase family 2 domain-containing protein, partial [Phycisphaerae bacterium]
IEKTAGTTLVELLRKHFGSRYLGVRPFWDQDPVFGPGDLRLMLKLFPRTRCLSSHSLTPHIALSAVRDDISFFTFLREPVQRYISHYRWQIEHDWHDLPLEKWITDSFYHDWMTKKLAGKNDPDAAYRLLRDRVPVVGLLERFDEGLLLLRRMIGDKRFDIHHGPPRNVSGRMEVKNRIDAMMQTLRPRLEAANRNDMELYRRVVQELYPERLRAYGETLAADLAEFQRVNARTPSFRTKRDRLFRRLYFRARVARAKSGLRESPNTGALALPDHWTREFPGHAEKPVVQ